AKPAYKRLLSAQHSKTPTPGHKSEQHSNTSTLQHSHPPVPSPLSPLPLAMDTAIAAYVLQSGRSNYALRDLVQGYLEITPPTNGAEMSAALALLEPVMRDRLKKESQEKVLDEIELPLIPLLAEMEAIGIKVNPTVLHEFSKQLEVEIAKTAASIYLQAGN